MSVGFRTGASLAAAAGLEEFDRTGTSLPAVSAKTKLKQELRFLQGMLTGKGDTRPVPDVIFWPAGMLALGLAEYAGITDDREGIALALEERCLLWSRRTGVVENLDDVLFCCALLRMDEVCGTDHRERLKAAAGAVMNWPEDPAGGFIYRPGREKEPVLADGIGMASMFLAMYGSRCEDTAAVDRALEQLKIFLDLSSDPSDGLVFHGYDCGKGKKENAECRGLSGWGRAVGWIMMGLSASLLAAERTDGPRPLRDELTGRFRELAAAAEKHRFSDGAFPWVLRTGEKAEDMSASAMIAFSELAALRGGILTDEAYLSAAERTGRAILEHMDGTGRIGQTLGECLDFGVHPQNYGHYPWGQGAGLVLLSMLAGQKEGKS